MVRCHAVNSGGDTVSTDPPLRWICVAIGVVVPDGMGDVCSDFAYSGMADKRLRGDTKDSMSTDELAFASVVDS